MAITLSGVVTGAAQTGLTTPTYTVAAAQAPTSFGKQFIVSALGGTQTGVETHSGSNPFLINFIVPASYRGIQVNAIGAGTSRGYNTTKIRLLKGCVVDGVQNRRPLMIDVDVKVPPGADILDPESVRAALSFLIGVLNNQSSGYGDTVLQGVA
nr:MAG: hypothetical protein 2 [Hangzhou atkins-like virus 3]